MTEYAHAMASTIGWATTRDGVTLLTRHWEPAGDPWAAALLVHGTSEHSGRYEHVGNWLAAAGIDVHAFDQRCWGGSSAGRGDIERWDDFLDDLGERLAAVRAVIPPQRPVVMYAHSLGGLIATQYVLGGRALPDYLVLSAPGIESTHPRWLRTVAAVGARVAPTMRVSAGHNGWMLSCDPAVGEAFAADPLAVHNPTFRLGAQGFASQRPTAEAIDRLRAAGAPFPLPTLVIHGTDDRIVPCAATERLGALDNVTRRVYPGIRHELHNEPQGESIVGDVIEWIRAHVAAARAA